MRCGNKLHQPSGVEIPADATIKYYNNRPCYLSAIGQNNIMIRYLDGECEYEKMGIGELKLLKNENIL